MRARHITGLAHNEKSIQKLVTGYQINFLCIDPDQVNHLKDLRGGIQKIGNLTCQNADVGFFGRFFDTLESNKC